MKKYRLVLVLALVVGLLAGVFTTPAVADPETGVKIQIPIIGAVTDDFTLAETWIQGQAQSDDTGVVVFFWSGVNPQVCPTNSDGPCGHWCGTPKDNEETWTIKDIQILDACSDGAKSAIIYFLEGDTDGDGVHDAIEACDAASGITTYTAWKTWKEHWEDVTKTDWHRGGQGQAVVHRRMLDPDGKGVVSDYVGVAPSMEADPDDPGMVDGVTRSYYAPITMDAYHSFNTVFHIQNSGQICTSVTVYYLNQETCMVDYTDEVGYLAPGETIDVLVPDLGPEWLGSARISAQTALGIIVDQFGRGLLLTHRANGAWVGDHTVYADLLYRELSGWISGIQVQNLSRTGWTWVQVEFFDNSGDQIDFLGDWVCPNTAYTFYLPAIDFLPFDYLGGAVIKSRASFWHGDEIGGEDIFAVVNLQNEIDTGKGLSYNAHPQKEKVNRWLWDLPMVVKGHQGVTSEIVIRNNSNCTKLRAYIDFYNQNGLVTTLPDLIIGPNMVTRYNLNSLGYLLDTGFNGAASVRFYIAENFCDSTSDEYNVVMPSVVVRQVDTLVPGVGDDYSGYEGVPMPLPCFTGITGTVTDTVRSGNPTTVVISDTIVAVDIYTTTTGITGVYAIADMEFAASDHSVTASKTGFFTRTVTAAFECSETTTQNFGLHCEALITGIVSDETSSAEIWGATVSGSGLLYGEDWSDDTVTDNFGLYELTVPANIPLTLIFSKTGYVTKTVGVSATKIPTCTSSFEVKVNLTPD